MLELKNITKYYGKACALQRLSMTVEEGQLYGFVGPNGAGKTTTMKMISGLLLPDYGELLYCGEDLVKNPAIRKEHIGYMPDFFGVYDNLKVSEYMSFYLDICGFDKKAAQKRKDELLELVGLKELDNELVDELSRGMKQRLCLARTMVADPEFLVLDEPASGMEPRARIEMKEILMQLCAEGKTILISSHILTELAQMCTHIGIIEHGSMVMQGSIGEIKKQQNGVSPMHIQLTEGAELVMKLLKRHPLATNIASRSGVISFLFSGGKEEEAELLKELIQSGACIFSYKREEGGLEELFLKLTKG